MRYPAAWIVAYPLSRYTLAPLDEYLIAEIGDFFGVVLKLILFSASVAMKHALWTNDACKSGISLLIL